MQVQYDLFSDNDDLSLMRQEIGLIDERTRNVQRGLFARHNALAKELYKLIEAQERQIEELRKLLLKQVK
jgi:hypothetical protein